MSTSGSVSWSATTNNIITYAMKYLGKLGEGDNLTSEEYNDLLWFLNAMVKQWIAKNDYAPGLKMWLRQNGVAFLANNTGQYVLGSVGGNAPSYWTNSYLYSVSGGANAPGATTINISTTTRMSIAPTPASNTSTTGALQPNMYVGIQCDDGSLYWTTVQSVTDSTTFTIPSPGLTVSSNNNGNVIFAFSTVATPPQVIEYAVLRDAQQNDTPIQSITLEDYMVMPSKVAPGFVGDPIAIYYQPFLVNGNGQSYGTMFTDVAGAQDTSKVIVLSYMQEIQDFVNPNDQVYFPKEWTMALVRGLAKATHTMYNATWTQEMEQETSSAIRFARNTNNKKTSQGFAVGIRGGEIQQQWR